MTNSTGATTATTDANGAWEAHRRGCWRCRRQWRKWEDGEMTCEQGVELFLAARHAQHEQEALF